MWSYLSLVFKWFSVFLYFAFDLLLCFLFPCISILFPFEAIVWVILPLICFSMRRSCACVLFSTFASLCFPFIPDLVLFSSLCFNFSLAWLFLTYCLILCLLLFSVLSPAPSAYFLVYQAISSFFSLLFAFLWVLLSVGFSFYALYFLLFFSESLNFISNSKQLLESVPLHVRTTWDISMSWFLVLGNQLMKVFPFIEESS